MNALVIAQQMRNVIPGGIGTYVDGLSLGLANQRDHHVSLWATRHTGPDDDPLLHYGLPLIEAKTSTPMLPRLWRFGLVPPKGDWRVVHATSLLTPKTKSPLTVMIHDLGWRRFPEAYPMRGRRWHERALKLALERAAHVFVPSVATANDLLDIGVERKRITTVTMGWDHLPDVDEDATDRLLQTVGSPDRFLLAVGTIEPRKNLSRLIEAYQLVRDELGDVPLLIAGPSGWGPSLKHLPGVYLLGQPPSEVIVGLYQRCELFVSVPLLEGYGLPILEAMSQGAPVVSSGTPSAGNATYLVDPENAGAIGEGIRRVCTDAHLRRELREKGRTRAATARWSRSADEHLEVWESL